MSLLLSSPEQTRVEIVEFLKKTYREQNKTQAVIAVSGGIDSALSLALLAEALPVGQITALLLPYEKQSTADAEAMCDFVAIPMENRRVVNIVSIVDAAATLTLLSEKDTVRKGNFMARARMMLVYDIAKEKDALVCGTENKSEHFLGYYTRFGDAASDIEPISNLYKTQVRQMAEHLKFPQQFLTKAPSAGLWDGQTDEAEMGFTYEQADRGIESSTVQAVIHQVQINRFKFHVPYVIQ
jgi:NAD+ synthase